MKTTQKTKNLNAKAKQIKKNKFWTGKRKFLVLSLLSLLSALIFLLTIVFLSNKNDNKQNAERLLSRAKELINSLPLNEPDYGLREIFPSAAVLSGSFEKGNWNIKTEPGKEYTIVFILPKIQDDYKKSGGIDRVLMATFSSDAQIPFVVVINPAQLREEDMKGINFDYLASTMLHESIHVYQRSLLKRKGIEVSSSDKESATREREAYAFQSRFINKILFDNKIDNKIKIPNLSIEKQNQMTLDGLSDFCKEIDQLNNWKLKSISMLVAFQAYPEMYSRLVTYNSIIKY